MATTTNYGFTVPTSADLVKNGATAISTLGQNVDTFLFRPFTRNYWMNGGLAIWQRGTSFSSASVYTADRWYAYFGSGTFTMARSTTDIATGFQYGMKVTSSGATASVGFYQAVETANAIQLAGKTVTMSGYIQSSNSGTFTMDIGYSTNTDEPQSGTFTSIGGQGVVSTTTSTRFSIQFAIPSTAKSLRFNINTPSLASGATATITGMQVEVGSVATPFVYNGGTIQGELAACQRYCLVYSSAGNAYAGFGNGHYYSTVSFYGLEWFPVEMRVAPSVTFSTATDFGVFSAGSLRAASAIASDVLTTKNAGILITTATATTGYGGWSSANNNLNAKITWSAEL